MEQIFPAFILGIVQGLTEFLPVSSSGHLIVLPKLFGWTGVVDSLEFDVALHLGTSIAVIGFFWRDWLNIFSSFFKYAFTDTKKLLEDPSAKLLLLILVGSIPAAVVGLSFRDFFETSVRSSLLVGSNLVIFGILLWLVDKAAKNRELKQLKFKDAVIVGIAQAASLIPGVSRSGITITAARSQRINRESAVRFSFLLSTPTIIGAALLTFRDFWDVGFTNHQDVFLIGFVSAAISGWFAIKFLLAFVRKSGFTPFVIYRVLLGIFLILTALIS